MSQKLDIFETEREFLIYDGIYSDSSIKNTQLVKSAVIEFGLHTILASNHSCHIFESPYGGIEQLKINSEKKIGTELTIQNKDYIVNKIRSTFMLDNKECDLKGISIFSS